MSSSVADHGDTSIFPMPSDKAVEAATASSPPEEKAAVEYGLGCAYPVIRADVANEIAAWVEERSGSALANWIRREFGAAS